MCLAVPVKVISIKDEQAEVEIGGVGRPVSIVLTPDVKVGNYVLLHAGYAISIVDDNEAEETLKLFEQIADLDEIH